jgi:hypothetical protein
MAPTPRASTNLRVSPRPSKRANHAPSTSPEPSTLSDDSALHSTDVPASTTTATSTHSDDDLSSEVSSSSDEPSDSSSEGEEDSDMEDAEDASGITNLPANRGQKPVMKLPTDDEMEDIRPFLKDFLPKLRKANEELEEQRRAGTLETAEMLDAEEGDEDGEGEEGAGGKEYIELNLGLGVLEAEGDDQSGAAGGGKRDGGDERAEDVLGKLMGREKVEPGVHVVEEREEQ